MERRPRKSSVRDLPTAPSHLSLFARCGNLAQDVHLRIPIYFWLPLLFLTQPPQTHTQYKISTMSDAAQQKDGQFSHDNTAAPVTDRVMPLFSLKGKTAIVSGAGAGIGLQIAYAFAEAGADVAIWYNGNKKAIERAAEIEKTYGVMCMLSMPSVDLHKWLISYRQGLQGRCD